MKMEFRIEDSRRHENDLTSVSSWVEVMQTRPHLQSILLFKVQGKSQPEEMDNMNDSDLVLVIQTMLCVCVDPMHKTNVYDFNLITLLVLDEFGEEVPVAWAISNREDTLLLTEVLKSIKEATGPLTSTVIYV